MVVLHRHYMIHGELYLALRTGKEEIHTRMIRYALFLSFTFV